MFALRREPSFLWVIASTAFAAHSFGYGLHSACGSISSRGSLRDDERLDETDGGSACVQTKPESTKVFVFHTAYQSQGDTMSSVLINVRTSPITADELDRIVDTGFFRDRIEAVNEVLKFLILTYKPMKIAEQIESLSKNVETDMSLTDALMSSRNGGDL